MISDVDDTILETGVQRVGQMLRQTFAGSALTRTPFPGAAELYRDLAAAGEPRLLRLLQPVEPPLLPDRLPPAPRLPARPAAAARPDRHPRRPRPQARADRGGARPAPSAVVRADRRLRRAGPGGVRRHRARPPGPDPGRLHPRGAPRPRRRSGRGRSATAGTTTCRSCWRPTATPYAAMPQELGLL